MAEPIPLLQLHDGRAPYKGVWSFEQTRQGGVQATHSTFARSQGPGCVIEHRSFDALEVATRFASHLLIHGWGVLDLRREGECLLYPPMSRS